MSTSDNEQLTSRIGELAFIEREGKIILPVEPSTRTLRDYFNKQRT